MAHGIPPAHLGVVICCYRITDAAHAHIAIRIPGIGIRIETPSACVRALRPMAASGGVAPGNVVDLAARLRGILPSIHSVCVPCKGVGRTTNVELAGNIFPNVADAIDKIGARHGFLNGTSVAWAVFVVADHAVSLVAARP